MTEEEREQYDGQIGMTDDPEEAAREALRQHQQEMGIEFEDPDAPVTVDPNLANAPDQNYG